MSMCRAVIQHLAGVLLSAETTIDAEQLFRVDVEVCR